MDGLEKHEKFLYPIVRVSGEKGTGSGTIIYNKPDPENKGDYETFVLTNHHVIASCISLKEDWNSLVKRKVETEKIEKATVEMFEYVWDSTVDGSNSRKADIIAYCPDHDLAVLKLNTPKKFDYVAPLLPEDKIKDLRLFQDIVVSGCSMAHDPFCNYGQLTFLDEIIERKKYFMANAGSYFGNSGGALFLMDTAELIGVPSRLTGLQLGFGVDMVLFMGFSAHIERIYEFIKEQEILFLIDPEDTFEKAMKRRENKEKEALMALKAEFVRNKDQELESSSPS